MLYKLYIIQLDAIRQYSDEKKKKKTLKSLQIKRRKKKLELNKEYK